MKHFFFVNPVAGQGKAASEFVERINSYMREIGEDYQVIMTEAGGFVTRTAAEIADALNGEEARFYACGGDGTLNEVINGIFGKDNIAVGSVPLGTGNDTIRNFDDAGNFLSVAAQVKGDVRKIDLIRYKGSVDGADTTGYCVNMINIGFDCNVVEMTGELKKKPLIAGSFAYLVSVFGTFIKKKGTSLTITEYGSDRFTSSQLVRDGAMLLCAVCNGSYCGGGIKSSPVSRLDDGVFELNIINDVTRRTFLKLFPKFKKGEHLGIPGIDEIVEVRKVTDANLESHDSFEFSICVDGEIKHTTGIRVTLLPKALNFIVPAKRL